MSDGRERFIYREGFRARPGLLAHDQLTPRLRNRLSNSIQQWWERSAHPLAPSCPVALELVFDYFGKSHREVSRDGVNRATPTMIYTVFQKGKTEEVLDLLEWIALRLTTYTEPLTAEVNGVLEAEGAAWRFVDAHLVRVTSPVELDAIDDALSNPLAEVQKHVEAAVRSLGPSEDPRTAVKEAISALEALGRLATGDREITLAKALGRLRAAGKVPEKLAEGWQHIYWYTSDAKGIRHAFKEGEEPPTHDEAKYFVVTACSLVNFLTATLEFPKS